MNQPEPTGPPAAGGATSVVEREVKLEVDLSFQVPDLSDLPDGARVVPAPEHYLAATYVDTDELRLARAGLTLRHRTEAEGGTERELWTLKLPVDAQGVVLARNEITWSGTIEQIPADAVRLVRATTLGAELHPVARLVTNRRRLEVHDATGVVLAEIADDQVDATRLDGTSGPQGNAMERFREIEVELRDGASTAVAEVMLDRLTTAGASAGANTPKLFRVLGEAAREPSEIVAGELGKKSTAADMVRASIAGTFAALTSHDPGLRLGGDIEHVHKARVATRRLRSDLRTFRSLLDPEWTALTRDELKWAGAALGAARDLDVLSKRFETQAATLGVVEEQTGQDEQDEGGAGAGAEEETGAEENREGTEQLLGRIAAERSAAGVALVEVLDSDRYLHLLTTLRDAALNPPLPGADAGARARYVVPVLVHSAWKRTRKASRAVGDPPVDEDLHELRKKAKALRYGAEAASPFVGKHAAKLATRAKALQDVLGDLQDAVVAREWLAERAASMGSAEALVAGQLMEHQLVLRDQLRAAWPKAWKKLRRKNLRAWLT